MRLRHEPTRRGRLADEHGFIGSFLIKLIVIGAVVALSVIEGGAILFARLQLEGTATAAAESAADSFEENRREDFARAAAEDTIRQKDSEADLTEFDVAGDGTVRLTVRKRANTILIQRIDFVDRFQIVRASGTGEPGRTDV